MTTAEVDHRSPERRAQDEHISAEPSLPRPDLLPSAMASAIEAHLQ
jgi:hypothetical protein